MDGFDSNAHFRRDSFVNILQGLDGVNDALSEVNSYLDSFPTIRVIHELSPASATGPPDASSLPQQAHAANFTHPITPWASEPVDLLSAPTLDPLAVDVDNEDLLPRPDSAPSPSPQLTPLIDSMRTMEVPYINRKRQSPDPGHKSRPPPRSRSMPTTKVMSAQPLLPEPPQSMSPNTEVLEETPPAINVTEIWKSSFEPQRINVVNRLQVVLREYTDETEPFATEIEKAAFDNAVDKDGYDKLLAIQCYKVRKLAHGELIAPSQSVAATPDMSGGTILPPPSDMGTSTSQRNSRPSLAFLGHLSAEELLTWEPG